MFTRKPRLDGDAVAAAQRRLASLAASFGSEHDEPSDRPGEPTPPSGEAVPGATRASTTSHRQATGERIRWQLTPQHAAVAALAVAALVAVAAWWTLRAVPHQESASVISSRSLPTAKPPGAVLPGTVLPGTTASDPSPGAAAAIPAMPVTTLGQLPATAPATGTGVTPTELVVDVAGKVRRPGIVELPAGSRVIDAIDAAGGVKPHAHIITLNLARTLVDGEQIVVGVSVPDLPAQPGSVSSVTVPTSAAATSVAPVNLNTATEPDLETLPGIGPVTAQSILAWRTENGAFTSVDQLLDVSGIGDAILNL